MNIDSRLLMLGLAVTLLGTTLTWSRSRPIATSGG